MTQQYPIINNDISIAITIINNLPTKQHGTKLPCFSGAIITSYTGSNPCSPDPNNPPVLLNGVNLPMTNCPFTFFAYDANYIQVQAFIHGNVVCACYDVTPFSKNQLNGTPALEVTGNCSCNGTTSSISINQTQTPYNSQNISNLLAEASKYLSRYQQCQTVI